MSYNEPMYLISVVSKQLQIHPQTLRQYEREGLIEPGRTGGKVRMYSQRDIDRIRLILRFTRDLGVNLAGVSVILQLKNQLEIYEQILKDRGEDLRSLKMLSAASESEELGEGELSEEDECKLATGAIAEGGALICKSSSELTIYKK